MSEHEIREKIERLERNFQSLLIKLEILEFLLEELFILLEKEKPRYYPQPVSISVLPL